MQQAKIDAIGTLKNAADEDLQFGGSNVLAGIAAGKDLQGCTLRRIEGGSRQGGIRAQEDSSHAFLSGHVA